MVDTQCYISFRYSTVTPQVYRLCRAPWEWSSPLSPDHITTVPLTYPLGCAFHPQDLFFLPLEASTSLSVSPIFA